MYYSMVRHKKEQPQHWQLLVVKKIMFQVLCSNPSDATGCRIQMLMQCDNKYIDAKFSSTEL